MNIDRINKLVEPIVTSMGYEFAGAEYLPARPAILRIYITREVGVNLDDCQKASQQISAVLDVEDVIPNRYRLEISSPGEHRRLFTLQQYQQFIGETVSLRLAIPMGDRRNIRGELKSVDDQRISVLVDDEILEISFDRIEKANLERQY